MLDSITRNDVKNAFVRLTCLFADKMFSFRIKYWPAYSVIYNT